MRKKLKSNLVGMNLDFNYRGEEQTRIETFSDAVFALAVTLLILSSTVPNTYEELLSSFADLIPFAICITLLAIIWYQHYIFFIRYGLKDVIIVVINTILLFLVLVYVYPLKFLFQILTSLFYYQIFGYNAELNDLFTRVLPIQDAPQLMVIYGLGAAGVFLMLSWMYALALKRKNKLELNDLEVYHTRTSLYDNLIMAGVPMLSVSIAFFEIGGQSFSFALSGFTYWLYAIILPIFYGIRKKRKRKLFN